MRELALRRPTLYRWPRSCSPGPPSRPFCPRWLSVEGRALVVLKVPLPLLLFLLNERADLAPIGSALPQCTPALDASYAIAYSPGPAPSMKLIALVDANRRDSEPKRLEWPLLAGLLKTVAPPMRYVAGTSYAPGPGTYALLETGRLCPGAQPK